MVSIFVEKTEQELLTKQKKEVILKNIYVERMEN